MDIDLVVCELETPATCQYRKAPDVIPLPLCSAGSETPTTKACPYKKKLILEPKKNA